METLHNGPAVTGTAELQKGAVKMTIQIKIENEDQEKTAEIHVFSRSNCYDSLQCVMPVAPNTAHHVHLHSGQYVKVVEKCCSEK